MADQDLANFWKDVDGYDHSVFEGDKIKNDDIRDAPADSPLRQSYIKAAEQVYRLINDVPEGQALPANMTPDRLVEFGLDIMTRYNFNAAATATISYDVMSNGTDAQKSGFLYLMNINEHTGWNGWESLKRGADGMLLGGSYEDMSAAAYATSAAGVGVNILGVGTLGAGFAAKEGAKKAGQLAMRQAMKEAVKQGVTRSALRAGTVTAGQFTRTRTGVTAARTAAERGAFHTMGRIAATEGVLFSSWDNAWRQNTEISTGGREAFNWLDFGMSAGVGAVAGYGLGYGGSRLFTTLGPKFGGVGQRIGDVAKWAPFRLTYQHGLLPVGNLLKPLYSPIGHIYDKPFHNAFVRTAKSSALSFKFFKSELKPYIFGTKFDPVKSLKAFEQDLSPRAIHTALDLTSEIPIPFIYNNRMRAEIPNDFFIKRKIRPGLRIIDESFKARGLESEFNAFQVSANDIAKNLREEKIDATEARRLIGNMIDTFNAGPNAAATRGFLSDITGLAAELKGAATYKIGDKNGAMGFTESQKKHFQDYIGDMQLRFDRLLDGNRYKTAFGKISDDNLASFIEDDVRHLANFSQEAKLRLDNGYHEINLLPRKTRAGANLEDVNRLERAIIFGGYNPETGPPKAVVSGATVNTENQFMFALDYFRTKIAKDAGTPNYSVPDKDEFARFLTTMYDYKHEESATQVMLFLKYAQSAKSIQTFPSGALEVLENWAGRQSNPAHARKFVANIKAQHLEIFHNNFIFKERWVHGLYAKWTKDAMISRMFPGGNIIAEPTKNKFIKSPALNTLLRTGAFATGGKTIPGEPSPDGTDLVKMSHNWAPWLSKSIEKGRFIDNNWYSRAPLYVKMATRWGSGGLISMPGLYAGGTVLGSYLIEEQLLENAFGIQSDLDVAQTLAEWTLIPAEAISAIPAGIFDYDNPVLKLGEYTSALGDAGDVSIEEATAAMSQYQLVNGQVVPMTPGGTSLSTHWNAGTVAKALADDDIDPTQANIQTVFHARTGGGSVAAPSTTTTTTGGTASTTTTGGTPSTTTTTTGGTPSTTTTTTTTQTQQRSARTQSFSRAGGNGSWIQAGGDMVGGVYNSAFDWDNNGSADGFMGSAGTFLSGMFGSLGGFIGDMSNGRIAGGEKWLAGGIGILAGLLGTGLLKSLIPGADKIPFLGIVLFALIAGFGGKLSFAALTGQNSVGQGNGANRPNGTQGTSSSHTGTSQAAAPPLLMVILNNTPGTGDRVLAIDDDQDGIWAPQLSMKNGKTFAPANFKALTQNELTPAILTQAKNDNMFVPENYLPQAANDATEWEAQAIDHTGLGKVVAFRLENAAANEPQYLVLDVAG